MEKWFITIRGENEYREMLVHEELAESETTRLLGYLLKRDDATVPDVANFLGIGEISAYRLLTLLREHGYVNKDSD